MADNSGQQDLRGLDIQKLAVAYEEEARIFRNFVRNASTSAREIRWFQKTAGILTATTTSGSSAPIANVAPGALPNVIEQSWTRNTSYVRKYFAASPIIAIEDIGDNDVDILAGNLRDIVIAIENQIDARIWDVLTESRSVVNINSVTTNAAWDTASGTGVDIIEDLGEAVQKIRENTYEKLTNGVLFVNPKDYKSMVTWLISIKGSSIPGLASSLAGDGVVDQVLGLKVVVSNNVTADYALVADPTKACVYKEYVPVTAETMKHIGIGTEIRVWAEGEAILERPKFCSLISNTAA